MDTTVEEDHNISNDDQMYETSSIIEDKKCNQIVKPTNTKNTSSNKTTCPISETQVKSESRRKCPMKCLAETILLKQKRLERQRERRRNANQQTSEVKDSLEQIKVTCRQEVFASQQKKLNSTEYECKLCLNKYSSSSYLACHVRQVHLKIKRHACTYCELKFYNKNDFKRHVVTHTGEKTSSYRPPRIADVVPLDVNDSTLTCEICKETFLRHKQYLSHLHTHFPNFVCDICGKEFVSNNLLRSHLNSIHYMKKETCDICNKVVRKANMKRHKMIHTGFEFTYSCLMCEEKFPDYSKKFYHMRNVHNYNPVEYKCKLCHKIFSRAGGLSSHVRKIHMGIKNHMCTICKQSFYNKNALEKHMITHTGERNYQCDVCCKRYGRKSSLKTHMKTHVNIL